MDIYLWRDTFKGGPRLSVVKSVVVTHCVYANVITWFDKCAVFSQAIFDADASGSSSDSSDEEESD